MHLGVANFVYRVGKKCSHVFRHTHTALGEGTARVGVNRMGPKRSDLLALSKTERWDRSGGGGVSARGTITNWVGSVFRGHVFGVGCCIALHLNEDIGYHQTQQSGEIYATLTYFSRAPLAIRATRARCRAQRTEVWPPLDVSRTRS